jgi:ATP-dependent helicase/nuclease subunit A
MIQLAPAGAHDAASPAHHQGSGLERASALARGALIHRLLQSLPDLAPGARMLLGRRHLARNGQAFSEAEREAMLQQAISLLDDPRCIELFRPGSRAEVPIVGRLAAGRVAVSGQIDRLAVGERSVLIADYKTNANPPRSPADVPPAYIRQLALYRAVLCRLYPDKTVRAMLIWTEIPELMELPAAAMDAELATLMLLDAP